MISPPEIVTLPALRTAFIPLRIPREKMPEVMHPAIEELLAVLQAQGVTPSGPLFCHHHRLEPGVFDFALSFPVATVIQAQGRVQPGRAPARKAARTVYSGAYEGLPGVHGLGGAFRPALCRGFSGDLYGWPGPQSFARGLAHGAAAAVAGLKEAGDRPTFPARAAAWQTPACHGW